MAVLAACATDAAPTYRIPDQLKFNFRWSGEPGLGLTTDAAIIARAYMESAFISYSTSSDSDRPAPNKYSYPGYDLASPKPGADEMVIGGMTMAGLAPSGTQTLGTFYAHLLELTADGSTQVNPPVWHAVMCIWVDALDNKPQRPKDTQTSTSAVDVQYQPFMNLGSGPHDSGTGRTVRLTMQQPPAGRPTRLSAGEGPARYPTTNVFGEWKITKANMTDSGSDPGPDSRGEANICANRPDNPVPPELRNRDYHTESDVPAPTLDQYPGWPASK
ncbi:hypothetical protein ACWDUL_01870 [Nocardia niigatensis]